MSSIFRMYCSNHDEAGPRIRRGAGGTKLIEELRAKPWSEWLIEHEFCSHMFLLRDEGDFDGNVQRLKELQKGVTF